MILENLKDQEIRKLFIFSLPNIQELEDKNKFFQSEYVDPLKAIQEINFLKCATKLRVYDSDNNLRQLEYVDFGYKFLQANPLPETKRRAQKFLIKLCGELEKRTENSESLVKKIGFCAPSIALNPSLKKIFSQFPENKFKVEKAEQQYRLLGQFDWAEIAGKPIAELKATEFWAIVMNHDNFLELGTYMLALNLLPLSNAATERIFSFSGATKTKCRNRLIISTLDSIIMIKTTFLWLNKCCYEYIIPDSCVEKFNNNIYD